jgi:chorismate dehydratase
MQIPWTLFISRLLSVQSKILEILSRWDYITLVRLGTSGALENLIIGAFMDRPAHTLRIGRIDYLNIWPVFHYLTRRFPEEKGFAYVAEHPSALNTALLNGTVDLSPSSLFEYLLHGERYRLLPGASISCDGPVQSVLLVSPVPLAELSEFLDANDTRIGVTTASATSVALLKILCAFAWNLGEIDWIPTLPGRGVSTNMPFLEIGNRALELYVRPPRGWHIIDLGAAWKRMTGLPFVFAVWIARRDLPSGTRAPLLDIARFLETNKERVLESLAELADSPDVPGNFSRDELLAYWKVLRYDLGPREMAGIAVYADYCTRLGLIPGMPALNWIG